MTIFEPIFTKTVKDTDEFKEAIDEVIQEYGNIGVQGDWRDDIIEVKVMRNTENPAEVYVHFVSKEL